MDENVPKSEWAPGPWHDEPDRLAWRDERTGLPCLIMRTMFTGSLCGYVGVPPGHAFFGWSHTDPIRLKPEYLEGDMDDHGVFDLFLYALDGGPAKGTIPLGMALKVHGGITWCGPPPDEHEHNHHWFGFDCGHAGDRMPGFETHLKNSGMPDFAEMFGALSGRVSVYRDIEFVKREVARLAFQLRQLEAAALSADAAAGGSNEAG